MASYGGWAGKVLRVDLSTGKISSEDTIAKYKDYLGGSTGIAYKVLWDEVPEGTKAWDPENKIIFGCGPLAGTGAPCGGRTAITSLWPGHKLNLVGSGHMGGHFAAELKFAGWDAIIVEGKATKPVYITIEDDKVEIRDAGHMWGNGIYRATAEICSEMGASAQVAAIGQAGENLVVQSVVITGYSHSAGGLGSVMGSKNLKAIGVKGTKSVKIAAEPKDWKKLNEYILSLVGANNQHVVPSTPQPWAEYSYSGSRWTASKGLYWGAANPPVETGTCEPHDKHSIAYRTHKGVYDFGMIAENFTTRMDGCHSCPIRCQMSLDVPTAEKYGVSRYATNTCSGWWARGLISTKKNTLAHLEAGVVGKHMTDDYGLWDNYGLVDGIFHYAYKNGYLKKYLSQEEYNSIPWDKYEANDPEFIKDWCYRVAYKKGKFGELMGLGSDDVIEKLKISDDIYKDHDVVYFSNGHPKHHANEAGGGQAGMLINTQYNRDSQCHSHSNFNRNGLPTEVQKKLAAEIFGSPDAVDGSGAYTPMNPYKAKFAKWSLLRKELHDNLALCNWMFPWIASPLKEREYRGDTSIEAQVYSAVTGDAKTEAELDLVAERIFNLHRALTIRGMGTKEMRKEHDVLPEYAFHDANGKKPFEEGTDVMDKADMEVALDMFYEELGWDKKTGSPTRETLEKLGLVDVAAQLGSKGLLP